MPENFPVIFKIQIKRSFDKKKCAQSAKGITNSVDPDQTSPEQSDLGLHCLLKHVCPKTIMVPINEPCHEKTSLRVFRPGLT